jgi:peptide/nickel transport system permease protein
MATRAVGGVGPDESTGRFAHAGRVPDSRPPAPEIVPMSYWRTVRWRLARDRTTLVAGAVLVLIVLSAVFAPWLAPYDPTAGSIRLRLASVGAPGHVLGTDEQGRDMLSRLLWGGRMTLVAGLTPVVVALVVGAALGVLAGYVGGLTGTLVMRTMDIFYAFPAVLLAIAISGALGPGLPNTLISLSIVFIPRVVRVAESATVQVKGLEYIAAARASGSGVGPIVRHHLLANVLGPILVFASTQVSLSMILAAGLSFLGLGVTPPAAEWGLMLNTLRQSIYVNAIVPALPGLAIFMTSMAFNVLSDGLRDAMEIRA